MRRDYMLYIKDMISAIEKIERYANSISLKEFLENELIQDGIIRNLEVLGEASKNIPEDIRTKYSQIEWRKIAGLRDILIHAYFNVDLSMIWDIISNHLPALKEELLKITKNEGEQSKS